MITTVLVANRGEIARRIMRTCRALGLGTVAVCSDVDVAAPYVAEADVAVRLPGTAPSDTYLRVDLLIDAARRAGADAIHPGYGFLSENAAFARAVEAAGLTWVGPPPEAIDAMGSKIEAKRLLAAAGVPVLGEMDPATLTEADLPVLIKASAGGGGRGMRIVRALADLPGELTLARAEAASAFGDETVFCEPYLATGHHVEVQVLADQHGTVWALGERECSIQRRHQKIVEEAPSPLAERVPGLRAALVEASVAAARAIGYVGAGTVEFLADEQGRFFFLEVNTRLQVEHPVTEAITGLDLVAAQLEVASGMPLADEPPMTAGHAIEVRLYAEDPASNWQPQAGTLAHFEVPGVDVEFAVARGTEPTLRLDSGVVDGSVVSTHYDPMLAKVIAWAPTRAGAARRLATALAQSRIHGLGTNRDLLVRVLRHPAFLAGDTDTSFLDQHGLATLSAPLADDVGRRQSALAAALAQAAANRANTPVLGGLPSGWRNVASAPQRTAFRVGDDEIDVAYTLGRDGLVAEGHDDVRLVSATPERVVLELDGLQRSFDVATYSGLVCVDSSLGPVALVPVARFSDPTDQTAPGSLLAPLPGSVVRVAVTAGEVVVAGQVLLWLEAMKMQHEVRSPVDGVVAELPVSEGQQVEIGAVLAVVQPEESA